MKNNQWQFRRLFSKAMYKDQKLPLGEMSFCVDFSSALRQNLYPLIAKTADCAECVENNRYQVKAGSVERMFGSYFPYASYEATAVSGMGTWGFSFSIPGEKVQLIYDGSGFVFVAPEQNERVVYQTSAEYMTMLVSCRCSWFDLYVKENGNTRYIHSFHAEGFAKAKAQNMFEKGFVSLCAGGGTTVTAVSFYLDCGIAQADIRHIRYENAEVMVQDGKIYLTMSVRLQEGGFQGIFSWVPGTSEFHLTGALFFDVGDGLWSNDVASSILYHREKKQWFLWFCSFTHGHILGHSVFSGDPRFGINVVDCTLMTPAKPENKMTDFVAFSTDEDPDFYFDEQNQKWKMAICRIDPTSRNYRYVFFESEQPFTGYQYIGQGYDGCETGGSFSMLGGERIFACGNDFSKRANYRIYSKDGMQEAMFNFDDGGFRGWGTIIPVELGSRIRYFWLTFDRYNASDFPWSYGNLYCFEAINAP